GLTNSFRKRFSFDDQRPLIVAASTHRPEERQVIDAFKLICQRHPDLNARLMIVPRHPERFAEVGSLLESSGFSWSRRSQAPSGTDQTAQIILLDSIGELCAAYPMATIVFLGGSFTEIGGHNLIEPALAGKSIITGPFMFNFADTTEAFVQADAMVKLPVTANPAESLYEALRDLLQNKTRREELANNALRVLAEGRGATERTLEFLSPIFESTKRESIKPL
ncbi:MAG: 3-deoxy-D-manno-octulosonic acid transferase, partial [Pyrinomonadaceae bacterium]